MVCFHNQIACCGRFWQKIISRLSLDNLLNFNLGHHRSYSLLMTPEQGQFLSVKIQVLNLKIPKLFMFMIKFSLNVLQISSSCNCRIMCFLSSVFAFNEFRNGLISPKNKEQHDQSSWVKDHQQFVFFRKTWGLRVWPKQ